MNTRIENGQNGVATSAVSVKVIDNRNNGGNFKWQIEKINVIKEYFNEDFFNDDLGQYIEVEIVVNSREVFPKVYFNGDCYVPEVSAFQSSKKSVSDMVASMTEMIKNIAVECGFIESDFYPTSFVNLTPNVFGTMVKNVFGTMGEQEQVVEQENENEQEYASIEYLRNVMPVVPVGIIKENIEKCVKDLNLDTMDFNEFCDKLWNDYVWEEVFTDEALESDTREYMEFNDRVRYIIENEINGVFIDQNDMVEVEVDYAPKNDTPCLVDNVYYVNSEYDIDRGIERVADTIEKYLLNYTSSYLDQFGDCVITVYWDYFSENDMKMLIENSIFALAVRDTLYERGVIENLNDFLVYDNGVYVTVDYDKIFNKGNVLNILRRECALCEVDEYSMTINALADRCGGDYVNAPIHVMYDKESDTYYVNGLGEDNDYAINEKLTSKTSYMELYDMITELLENENDIIEYIYGLDSRPSWVTRNDINVVDSYNGDYLDIVMFGSYHVGLYYDSSESVYDFAKVDSSSAYSVEDMRYAVEIMENRDYIVSLAKKVLAKCGLNKVA